MTLNCRWVCRSLALSLLGLALGGWANDTVPPTSCRGTLYLTLDTGSMQSAETIAEVLHRHHVRATFFMANEPTWRGDHALDDSWAEFWRARVREGHHFGSHTWHHATLVKDLPSGQIQTRGGDHAPRTLDKTAFCAELNRVGERFQNLTGEKLQPLWRAPGGRLTPNSLVWAQECGFTRHVDWNPAGFLGDELPSETYPNDKLLKQALNHIRSGDILMMHLGIRSRHDPFVNVFEPLITGLQSRGFCFATLP
ncbi:MAG: polysaccharide deacetylase family protein [Ferrovum sp.]|nr:polysaccharide deacetylase family protein [Ferrovum sp.]NDU87303.1 polysaccharide deacetylase family protein [Ferrovum sp.]